MKKLLNKGFTIVELVIVIAVIGILAAVLIPTFSNVIESANETADLQEAQSTLKAYTAYMTSKGSPLTDGAVFKIEETGRTYVFYKGELHKFDATKESNTLSDDKVAPAVYVGKGIYACNKVFSEFVDGDQPGQTDDGYITFFYNDLKAIEFEDGSLKCSIYPGLVLACDNSFSNASPDYPEGTTTISVGTYKLFDKKIDLDATTNTATITNATLVTPSVATIASATTADGNVIITKVGNGTTKVVVNTVVNSKTYTFTIVIEVA